MRAKLLPKAPVFDTPKLTVPREIRTPRPQQPDVAPPKIEVNNFTPAVVKQVTGGARPTLIVHTGEFGSSATPTVNAPIQKVQTGGFGDPERDSRDRVSPTLTWWPPARAHSICLPDREPATESGGAKGIKGTIASAGFGNGIAQAGQGDGRSNGRGATVQTAGFVDAAIQPGRGPAAAGRKWTSHDTCGNHLQAQSGLH